MLCVWWCLWKPKEYKVEMTFSFNLWSRTKHSDYIEFSATVYALSLDNQNISSAKDHKIVMKLWKSFAHHTHSHCNETTTTTTYGDTVVLSVRLRIYIQSMIHWFVRQHFLLISIFQYNIKRELCFNATQTHHTHIKLQLHIMYSCGIE